jgi:hypothetical protein
MGFNHILTLALLAITQIGCNCRPSWATGSEEDNDSQPAPDLSQVCLPGLGQTPEQARAGLQSLAYFSEDVEQGGDFRVNGQSFNVQDLCLFRHPGDRVCVADIGLRREGECRQPERVLGSFRDARTFENTWAELFRDMQGTDADVLGIMYYYQPMFTFVADRDYYIFSRTALRNRIGELSGEMSPRQASFALLDLFSSILASPPEAEAGESAARFEVPLVRQAYLDDTYRAGVLNYTIQEVTEPLSPLALALTFMYPAHQAVESELSRVAQVRGEGEGLEVLLEGEANWINGADFFTGVNCRPDVVRLRQVRGLVRALLALSMRRQVVEERTEGDLLEELQNGVIEEICADIPAEEAIDRQSISGGRRFALRLLGAGGISKRTTQNLTDGISALEEIDEALLNPEGANEVIAYLQALSLLRFADLDNLSAYVERRLDNLEAR